MGVVSKEPRPEVRGSLRLVRPFRYPRWIFELHFWDKIRNRKCQFFARKLLDRHDLIGLDGYVPGLDLFRLF